MPAKTSKSHTITIRVRFDAPLTARQARYAVWNALQGHTLYGDGKPTKDYWSLGDIGPEPYGTGTVTVRR